MCIYAIPSREVTYLSYVGHLILDIKHYPNWCFKIFIIDETCEYKFLKCCENSITMKCYHIHSELVSHIYWMVTTYFWIFSIFQKYYHIFHQWQMFFGKLVAWIWYSHILTFSIGSYFIWKIKYQKKSQKKKTNELWNVFT